MSTEEKPEARDAIVPPSYSTPSVAPEALELFEAFRSDVKELRGDVVDGLEEVKQEIHRGLERNAGHTLAVYRIVEQKIGANADEARAHRAEFVAFAAAQRALEADLRAFVVEVRETQTATKNAVESIVKGERITSPQLTAIELDALPVWSFEALALRLRVPRATLRLVAAATLATWLVFLTLATLTACAVHAGI